MAYSNTSLNTFASCMKKYKLKYIDGLTPEQPRSPHLVFGEMAHEVLYKAGRLRDDVADGAVSDDDYYTVIPSEVLYNDLKEYFNIDSWERYFTAIIKQTAEYEKELCRDTNARCCVMREVKLSVSATQLARLGYIGIDEALTGVVDLLILGKSTGARDWDMATIIDYKFATRCKTQDDFDLDSQLMLYALLVSVNCHIPLRNIKVGYISIPKAMFDNPTMLESGKLSRSKSQNVLPEAYRQAVEELHGNDPYYNCLPSGYYYDCYTSLALNKVAYMSLQYLDIDVFRGVIKETTESMRVISGLIAHDLPFSGKYDKYSCAKCEYLHQCKPWLFDVMKKGDEEDA